MSAPAPALSLAKAGPMLLLATTSHGLKMDVVSSALQKALRRNDSQLFRFAFVEWFLMRELPGSQGAALLTNLLNRMHVYMVEDMNAYRDPALVGEMLRLLSKWKPEDPATGRFAFAAARAMLAAQFKGRYGSDIRTRFQTALALKLVEPPVDANTFATPLRVSPDAKDSAVAVALLKQFVHHLLKRDDACFHYLFQIMACTEPCNTRYHRKTADMMLWMELERRSPTRFIESMRTLYCAIKERREKFLFLVHAVLSVMHPSTVELIPIDVPSEEEWARMLAHHRTSVAPAIPPYCVDKHTREGARAGKTALDFAKEGSFVAYEVVVNQSYRDLYLRCKELDVEKPKPTPTKRKATTAAPAAPGAKKPKNVGAITQSTLDGMKLVGQRVTATWKVCTWYADGAVFKGPYEPKVLHRLAVSVERSEYLTKMGVRTPAQSVLVDPQGKYWLRMEQIGTVPQSEWKVAAPELMINGKTGSIVDRESTGVVCCSHLSSYTAAVARDIWLALVARYILDPPIGDSGMWNLLCRKSDGAVFCVDLEEERHTDKIPAPSVAEWSAPLTKRMDAGTRALFERLLGLGRGRELSPALLAAFKSMIATEGVPLSAERIEHIRTTLGVH